MSDQPPKQVVGIAPWLPWPLSAWPWWTEPVRAERLAALRIGVGLALLFDVCFNYLPDFAAFYGKGGIGDPAHFDWYFLAHRTNWSLLRGVGHEAGLYLALIVWIAMTLWILGNGLTRVVLRKDALPDDRTGVALPLWTFCFAWYVMGVWSHMLADGKAEALAWVLPLGGFSMACLFFSLDLAHRLADRDHRVRWWSATISFSVVLLLLWCGLLLTLTEEIDPDAWWARALKPWPLDETLLQIAMFAWIGAAFLLVLGLGTRWTSVAAWMLSLSFANANSYLDNAGDTIRVILLFYLMLCPAGAVWSVDAWFARRPGLVYVHPWPTRLIFLQMIFIYFMNGLYKLGSPDWREGMSLHYVLSDVTFTRFSYRMLPVPFWMTQIMTWTVLFWEATFPFMMIFKWTRWLALGFGVLFHLGILATMELGGFQLYALCMYLPLVPWERWSRRQERSPK
jgi:hypothetical protein